MTAAERERVKALEERVAYLEGLVRELLARPLPPVQVVPWPYPVPQPALPPTPWRWTAGTPYRINKPYVISTGTQIATN